MAAKRSLVEGKQATLEGRSLKEMVSHYIQYICSCGESTGMLVEAHATALN